VKAFGVFILIIGIIVVFLSLSMDTSVTTTYGQRVNNLGLMRINKTILYLDLFVFLVGF
jgi:hypothetical protein